MTAARLLSAALLCGVGASPTSDLPPVLEMLPDGWRLPIARRVMQSMRGLAPPPLPARPVAPVTSSFGWRRDPFTGKRRWHSGTDFRFQPGTIVPAPAESLVLHAGPRGNYGITVVLAQGPRCLVLLAHLGGVRVRPGEIVPAGWPVGWTGSSGRSTGPHLHYEHRCDGRPHRARAGSGSPQAG